MRIAIVGTGISGLTAAARLHGRHQVDVFECNDYPGGHSNTVDVVSGDRILGVDTGFIVFNDRTYPEFMRLIDSLGVAYRPTTMGFSVRSDRDNLEYGGSSAGTLFAQKRNLVRPAFYRMLADILRFNRRALNDAGGLDAFTTLGEYLSQSAYSRAFAAHYLVPMGAAIWSTDPAAILEFPARTFIGFFANHGLLNINDRPQWYVIRGGSKRYVEALTAPFADRIRLHTPVTGIERFGRHVQVVTADGTRTMYDKAIIAAHSDQALRMLSTPTRPERDVLGALSYQPNEAVLHTDTQLLPRRRKTWAAWNYHVPAGGGEAVTLTYNMNILQHLDTPETYCVTLNNTDAVDPARIIRRIQYSHPVFDARAIGAQRRWAEISGVHSIHYCGAYWGYGFHEDGVVSALKVVDAIEREGRNEQLLIRRAG